MPSSAVAAGIVAARSRQRHRRIDPVSRVRLRPGGAAPVVRPGAGVQPKRDRGAFALVAADLGPGPDRPKRPGHAVGPWRDGRPRCPRSLVGSRATRGRGMPRPLRVAVVTEPDDLCGARLHPTVVRCAAQGRRLARRRRLRDRGRPDARLHPRRWNSGSPCRCRRSARICAPSIEQHGDDGIRRAVGSCSTRFPAADGLPLHEGAGRAGPPGPRSGSASSRRRRWCWRRSVTQPIYTRGFDLESRERTAAALARVRHAHRRAGARGARPGGADRIVDGLPTGVQILAPRFREDLCLAAGEAIEARAGMTRRLPTDIQW